MMDRTTKLLLLLIALGLWVNVAIPFLRPRIVAAQSIGDIDSLLSNIESDVHKLARGTCTNTKICE
jgi:hypothetical protein